VTFQAAASVPKANVQCKAGEIARTYATRGAIANPEDASVGCLREGSWSKALARHKRGRMKAIASTFKLGQIPPPEQYESAPPSQRSLSKVPIQKSVRKNSVMGHLFPSTPLKESIPYDKPADPARQLIDFPKKFSSRRNPNALLSLSHRDDTNEQQPDNNNDDMCEPGVTSPFKPRCTHFHPQAGCCLLR